MNQVMRAMFLELKTYSHLSRWSSQGRKKTENTNVVGGAGHALAIGAAAWEEPEGIGDVEVCEGCEREEED